MSDETFIRDENETFVFDAIASVPAPDPAWEDRAWARLDSLTKPPRSLGYLEQIAQRLAVLQRSERPSLPDKAIVLMAGDHGVTAEGVSPYPSEVTAQMVANFAAGGAAINQLAAHAGARVVVVDVGVAGPLPLSTGVIERRVANGTANMAVGPAMTREQAAAAIRVGIETVADLVDAGASIVGTGDMGIGNTTASSAIVSVLTGVDPADVVGPGTGLDSAGVVHKAEVIRRALAVNAPDPQDALDVLAKVGGLEIAGIAGVILGAAANRVAVVVDGFISGAGALIAGTLAPQAIPFMIAGHKSVEGGHTFALQHLGLSPLLDLDLRLGEGTGACLAISLVEAATKVLAEMATFGEAGVSEA
jgi:nicotinate-nucleotide--dimethylbenzimidazole phosphoribosyltransferase